MDLGKFKSLASLPGLSSFEDRVVSHLEKNLDAKDLEIQKDGIGSLIVKKKTKESKNPLKLMFATHIDEIGFLVEDFRGNFLKLRPVGSTWTHLVVGQIYQLINKYGKRYNGDISLTIIHILSCLRKR